MRGRDISETLCVTSLFLNPASCCAVSSFLGFKKICPDLSLSKSMLSAPKSTLLWLSVCYTSSGQPVKRRGGEDKRNFPGVVFIRIGSSADVTVWGQKLEICSKFCHMFCYEMTVSVQRMSGRTAGLHHQSPPVGIFSTFPAISL